MNHLPALGYIESTQTRIHHGYGAHEKVRATRILPRTKEKERQGRRISQVSSRSSSPPMAEQKSLYMTGSFFFPDLKEHCNVHSGKGSLHGSLY